MKVSFDKLEDAMLASGYEISNWVDKKTGNVIFITSEFLDDEAYFENEEEQQAAHEILIMCGELEPQEGLEIDENRYVEVATPSSDEKWKWMEEFTVNHVSDNFIQNKLADALRGGKPFRRFKDALLNFPEQREKWFEFENQKLREFIKDWAESEQLEIDFDTDK